MCMDICTQYELKLGRSMFDIHPRLLTTITNKNKIEILGINIENLAEEIKSIFISKYILN